MATDVRMIGRMGFSEALALQESLVEDRRHERIPDTLLLVEHPAIFTLGRATTKDSLPKSLDIPQIEVSRGGNITYHGPGQVVGYWIRKLVGADRDLHAHLRCIEEQLIASLTPFGLRARRDPGRTGVWIDDKKVASIGVAVKFWISYHGFALNVDVDANIYREFRPCGLDGDVMSDVSRCVGAPVKWSAVAHAIAAVFSASSAR